MGTPDWKTAMQNLKLHPDNWIPGPGYRKQRIAGPDALACAGALVQMVEMAPGATIPDHVHHTSSEFYFVVAGTCLLVIDGRERRLAPGDMILTQPGDVHRLHNDGAETFRLLVFKTNAGENDTFWTAETAV